MKRCLVRLAILAAAVAAVPACTPAGQTVVPRAMTASHSLTANDPNPSSFVSNRGHEMELITSPNGNLAIRIKGEMRDSTNPSIHLGEVDISVTSGATLGPATYGPGQGEATIIVAGQNGTWSSSFNQSFHLEVTQLDLARNQASGTFRFRGKRAANEVETLHVTDGAFLFLSIDDHR